MSDRELLEMAAKAADVRGSWVEKSPEDGHPAYSCGIGRAGLVPLWNPLSNDGDAFRLAVKLHMTVDTFVGGCEVGYDDMRGGQGYLRQDDGPDGDMSDSEVVRRAIVRAAAEMGRAE